MKLGELLKSYRTEHKLSMDAFCELSDLTKGYISMLEKNEHPKSKKPIVPSYETIEKIANFIIVKQYAQAAYQKLLVKEI